MHSHASILDRVALYYSEKIRARGPTAAGVDWKSEEQQDLRFDQLLRIVDLREPFSINDYGCGYGALAQHLRRKATSFEYSGYDISSEMIDAARRFHRNAPDCRFFVDEPLLPRAEFTLASGIFNVKGDVDDAQWTRYALDTIARIAALSTCGFAFNVLTTYVDYRRPDLYYADPCQLLEHCISRYSRRAALLHDYGLYEFTLLVRL